MRSRDVAKAKTNDRTYSRKSKKTHREEREHGEEGEGEGVEAEAEPAAEDEEEVVALPVLVQQPQELALHEGRGAEGADCLGADLLFDWWYGGWVGGWVTIVVGKQ